MEVRNKGEAEENTVRGSHFCLDPVVGVFDLLFQCGGLREERGEEGEERWERERGGGTQSPCGSARGDPSLPLPSACSSPG